MITDKGYMSEEVLTEGYKELKELLEGTSTQESFNMACLWAETFIKTKQLEEVQNSIGSIDMQSIFKQAMEMVNKDDSLFTGKRGK